MKKTLVDLAAVMAVLLLWAGNASATPTTNPNGTPDGGATSLLFVASLAGVAAVRKFLR